MTNQRMMVVALAAVAVLTACGSMQTMTTRAGHPGLSEQQMLTACSDCHRQATPQLYDEWYASTHGLGSVKCYQCHGTFEGLRKTPDMQGSCGSCHADKLGDHTGSQNCWNCHDVHSFSVN